MRKAKSADMVVSYAANPYKHNVQPNMIFMIKATKTGHQTKTVTVEAGSSLGFAVIVTDYSSKEILPHPVRPALFLSKASCNY